jgi:hypothetical protein
VRLRVNAPVIIGRAERPSTFISGDLKMRKKILLSILGLVLLFGGAATSRAEVRRVQMHIAGYLCGN